MKRIKFRERVGLHPVMTYLILCLIVIVFSGVLSWFNVQATYNQISTVTGEYQVTTEAVYSLFSLSGLKYIFTNTVANFANFAVLPHLIIILLGIGVMEKSGFLKTFITFMTRKAKKITVTFALVLMCLFASIMGDIAYIIFIPISALLFLYGKRNPAIGIIASFAALTCGYGVNIFFTSIDSSLLNVTKINANVLFPDYAINSSAFFIIMLVTFVILAFLITNITENYVAKKLAKYEFSEDTIEEEIVLNKKKARGLLLAGIAGMVYLLFFIYNIIPGLPFSGNLLDYSQELYIDKLFSYNSFFSNGFVFIVALFFVILGLFYGIGAKTIKNNKDFVEALGHSLNDIGKILLMIFAAATFISIFKQSNIGNVIAISVANIIGKTSFTGLPLLLLLFIGAIISTLFLPSSLSRWSIISTTAVPVVMNAGISPEFAQVVFRFGESVALGLTPVFAYFIVYLAYLEKYNQDKKNIRMSNVIKLQIPYVLISAALFLVIILMWYIIGLPLGIHTGVSL